MGGKLNKREFFSRNIPKYALINFCEELNFCKENNWIFLKNIQVK
jgi:hypothetical protein